MIRAKHVNFRIQQLRVLVVDDSQFMRNIVRSLLTNIGVKKVGETLMLEAPPAA